MKRTSFFLVIFTSFAIALQASPTPKPKHTFSKSQKKMNASDEAALATNGWSYVKGEWIHPDGYKLVKGQVIRTTAKTGKPAPEPPGKLAQGNARKMPPKATPAPVKTATEKAAEERRKNLTPTAAPQTGSHL